MAAFCKDRLVPLGERSKVFWSCLTYIASVLCIAGIVVLHSCPFIENHQRGGLSRLIFATHFGERTRPCDTVEPSCYSTDDNLSASTTSLACVPPTSNVRIPIC